VCDDERESVSGFFFDHREALAARRRVGPDVRLARELNLAHHLMDEYVCVCVMSVSVCDECVCDECVCVMSVCVCDECVCVCDECVRVMSVCV